MNDPYHHNHRAPDARPRAATRLWEVAQPGNVYAPPAIADSSHVVTSARGPGRAGTVQARELATGRPFWEHTLTLGGNAAPVLFGDRVVVAGEDGRVASLDARTGAVAWETELGGPIGSAPLVVGDRLIAGIGLVRQPNRPGGLTALSAAGQVVWTVEAPAPVAASPTLFDARRAVFATVAGTVHTVELATGRLTDLVVAAESDHDSAEAPVIGSPIGAPPVRLDGITVVLSTSGTLLAIDDEGTERWSWASSSSTPSSGLATDGERVFQPGTDGRLLAFDAHDGRPAWHVERLGRREPGVWSTPLVIGDVLLAVCSTGHLIAVAAADGREIFSERLPGAPVATRLESDAEGRFLVATLGQEMKVACWSLES